MRFVVEKFTTIDEKEQLCIELVYPLQTCLI